MTIYTKFLTPSVDGNRIYSSNTNGIWDATFSGSYSYEQIHTALATASSFEIRAGFRNYSSDYDRGHVNYRNIENTNVTGSSNGDLIIAQGIGTTYKGGYGDDTFYANWSNSTANIVWNNDPNPIQTQTVNGITVSGFERLLLMTGDGDDSLSNLNTTTDDYFDSGAGNDTIQSGAGNDTLHGGSGADILQGGDGNDVYQFNIGDGHDQIIDTAGTDKLVLGANITASQIGVSRVGNEIRLAISADDSIRFTENAVGSYAIERIEFQNGTVWTATQIQQNINSTVNHTPALSHPLIDQTIKQQSNHPDAIFSYAVPANSFTDIDGDTLTYRASLADGSALPNWLGFDANTRTFSGKTVFANAGTLDIRLTAIDSSGASVSDDFKLVVEANHAPTVVAGAALVAGVEDTPYIFNVADFLTGFSDADGDNLSLVSLVVSPSLPASVVNNNNGTYTISTPPNYNGNLVVYYIVEDGRGGMINSMQNLAILPVNDAPVLAHALIDQATNQSSTFSYTIPADSFTDVDVGDTLSYQASQVDGSVLPVWLSFDAATRTFSCTPLSANVGALNIKLTATDNAGASVSDDFMLTITAGNKILTGGVGGDIINGGAGDDILDGGVSDVYNPWAISTDIDMLNGGAGKDTFLVRGFYGAGNYTGGDGSDWLDFSQPDAYTASRRSNEKAGVKVDLTVGTASTYYLKASNFIWADATGQIALTGIENIRGTTEGDSLSGDGYANVIDGGQGSDVINGGAGNDILDGGVSDVYNPGVVDTLNGGAGNDTFLVRGFYGAGKYTGGADSDTLDFSQADSYTAGRRSVEVAGVNVNLGAGTASTYYRVTDNFTWMDASGQIALTSIENVRGTAQSDRLLGDSNINVLEGGEGNDILGGGASADTLIGGTGNDTYYVDVADDVIIEAVNGGTDIVYSTAASYTLSANIENLVIWGTGVGGTGNALNNYIIGSNGNNIIDGGAGADILYGGLGSDAYYVDNSGDITTEIGTDWDVVYSTAASYTLNANIEALFLVEDGVNRDGSGNAQTNYLIGNAGNNSLDGQGGADVMAGGAGDDSYTVDNTGDVVVENADAGMDTVYSSISYTLAANAENLVLTGIATDAFGNHLNNQLTGNHANNIFAGGAGADTMTGLAGNDTYYVDVALDSIIENAGGGTDIVYSTAASYTLADNIENLVIWGTNGTGNALSNYIFGNTGNNTLDGRAGNDILYGDEGADTYIGGLGADSLNLTEATAATDTVRIATGDSLATVGGYDLVAGFKLGTGIFNTTGVDKLDLANTAIAANVTAADGIDSGVIRSHSINNGIISFDDINNYTSPLAISTSTNLANVFSYLQTNITDGNTVAFVAENNTYVFQDGGVTDTLVELLGVTATSVNNSGLAANSVWVI